MNIQDLSTCRHFLLTPATSQVDVINEQTFTHFAKAWVYMGFLPVLMKIEPDCYYVKLYFDTTKITYTEELFLFSATYFCEKFRELSSHVKCTLILVYASNWLDAEAIASGSSLQELEQALINTLSDKTPVMYNEKGEGHTILLSNLPAIFLHWNRLVLDGFFEPDYEEKTDEEASKQKTVSVHLFLKTGGLQPTILEPKLIDQFFKGNLAKRWAMLDGYLPTFKGYENGVIQFSLVTDPRCTGLFWNSLCNFIAVQYKKKVVLLNDATNFRVEHFVANDIIGFNITADQTEKIIKYSARVKASHESLPKKPIWIHYGKINL
jgi:hypothetical protein